MNTKRIGIALTAFLAAGLVLAGAYRAFFHASPVAVVAAAEGKVQLRVIGPGTVQARIPVTLASTITASVASLHADHGDKVKRGQLLAVLDDRDLAARRASVSSQQETVRHNIEAARATVARSQADLDLASTKYRRDLDLFRANFVSQGSLDASLAAMRSAEAGLDNARAALAARETEHRTLVQEARYAEAVLSHTRIVSPINGEVVQRQVEVGSTVVPGSAIFRLVDPATLWVATRIDESTVGKVRIGMPADIRLRTGEAVSGKVARISRLSDAATRELEVDVAFDTPPTRFAIDQEAEVTIHAGAENGVAVPVSALVQSQGKQGLLVLKDGRAQFQPVETGASDERLAVIRRGLAPGEKVIADPQSVKPGARVRAVTPG